ncbi:MAG: hypothetical protein KUA37_02060 [Desulfomicrobium sp.]|nr:hypothetical protein [Pseudomonadota bacterium]MBV1710776.1 hypothetical protein [Desulfomicrobium sp.]MBU4570384.1 hypothetical protein [Pseudomonadota bacterium]MBU4593305.1 hypothetical protein [Pseudomonadota bacterium]MBV1721567.1 hypothetical protein [Desulfomicrobium sp.]
MEYIKELLEKFRFEMDGMAFNNNDKNRLSAALFDISLDHSRAIIKLLDAENPNCPSAYALVRPMFECFLRASWIFDCSSISEIECIKKQDKFPLSYEKMLLAVEKSNQWPETLTQAFNRGKNNLHSFTHGGMQLVSRRFEGNFLIHNIDQDEIQDLIKFIVLISFMSFIGIVRVSETNEKNFFIEQTFHEIIKRYIKS